MPNNIPHSTTRSIMLVEDDRLVLVTLSGGLKSAGYIVSTAESVEDAEETLSSGERPDLIVLDVNLHQRSGLELAERLRAFDHIPFMLLTAFSDQEIISQAKALGALGYLVKPVDTSQLIPAIEAAISRAQELRSLRNSKDQLQLALDGEREISIAIGITMVQYRVGRKAAFELLRKQARSQRRKLAELAADIVKACDVLSADSDTKSS